MPDLQSRESWCSQVGLPQPRGSREAEPPYTLLSLDQPCVSDAQCPRPVHHPDPPEKREDSLHLTQTLRPGSHIPWGGWEGESEARDIPTQL